MDIYKTSIFRYVNGDMLAGQKVQMVIRGVDLEKVTGGEKDEEKPVLYFEKSRKPLVLNATNSKKLAKVLGRETNGWTGAKVELYAEEVKAFGKVHNAVRIGKIEKPAQVTPEQRKARKADNTNLLRGSDPGAIGEDEPIQPMDIYQTEPPAPEAEGAPAEEFNF